MSGQVEASRELGDLLFFAVDHGVESIRDGGPLIPFVVVEIGGERRLTRFAAERLEEGVAQAAAFANAQLREVDRCALAWDGYITIPGDERRDAIYVEGTERGRTNSVVLGQRYLPRRRLRKFTTIGNPALLQDSPRRLTKR